MKTTLPFQLFLSSSHKIFLGRKVQPKFNLVIKKQKFFLSLITISLFCLSFQCLYSQSPNWTWAKSAGGSSKNESYDIAVDASGNSYITGYFEGTVAFGNNTINSTGNGDIFVAKYDMNGNVIWARKAGGSGWDLGYGISIDASGNAYVTGYFGSTAIFGSDTLINTLNADIFVAKYDTNGNLIWAKSAGGNDNSHGYDISVDVSGNIYVTGCFSGITIFGNDTLKSTGPFIVYDIFVAKYDANGNVIWAKRAGGSNFDEGKSICLDASGNILVTGYFEGSADFGNDTLISAGNADIFVAKYDTSGNVIWTKKAGRNNNDFGYGISVDTSGNTCVTGCFIGTAIFDNDTLIGAGNNDIFVTKYDTNGNLIWARKAGGNNQDFGRSISIDKSGNLYVTGNFSGTAIFGNDTLISAGIYDIFIVKYDANGNKLWVKKAGGSAWDIGYGISVDASSNAYVAGYFESFATFGSNTINSFGQSDIFIAQLGSTTTSINEYTPSTQSELLVFPNPARDNFSINYSENYDKATISIVNALGQTIETKQFNNSQKMNFDVSSCAKGIYFVKAKIDEKAVSSKLIVE